MKMRVILLKKCSSTLEIKAFENLFWIFEEERVDFLRLSCCLLTDECLVGS